jgi:hypothetical protein
MSYIDKGNGFNQDTKVHDISDGMIFAEVKANVGGADIGIACEKVDGKDNVTSTSVRDMRLKGTVEVKI